MATKTMWAGRIVSAVPTLFLLFDAAIHILRPQPVVEAFQQLGYPISTAVPIGIIELLCVALYLIPRTAALGAILVTAHLGGAVATHVRVGDPPFRISFPVMTALLFWGGLYLRDARVRALFNQDVQQPMRKD